MSYIDILVLSTAYYRHDDRELWDMNWPVGVPMQAGAVDSYRNIARATRNQNAAICANWWPRNQIFADATLGEDVAGPPASYDERVDPTGASGYPYRIRGYALDSVGTGVGGAKMQLFRTSDDAYLGEATSVGPSGQYDLGVDTNSVQHYIVAYRTGPDIEGTTVNTLTGASD